MGEVKMNITGQPAQGRSAGGGLRIGGYESDAITANGMMSFTSKHFIERSDGPAFPCTIEGHHETPTLVVARSLFQKNRSPTLSHAVHRRFYR
jgi:DNA-directed RNA polymerase beta subunit